MIFSVISSVLIIISIVCLFGLTPEQVTDDLMRLITPNDTMRYRSRNLRGNKKKHRLYRTLVKMKTALAVTGKSKQFTIVCCASLVLFAAGIILSVLIDNIFLMPVLSVAFALIPFFYTTSTLSYYEKNTKEELETALSIKLSFDEDGLVATDGYNNVWRGKQFYEFLVEDAISYDEYGNYRAVYTSPDGYDAYQALVVTDDFAASLMFTVPEGEMDNYDAGYILSLVELA